MDTETKFIFMGDPQCSRISGKDNDYSQWEGLLRKVLSRFHGENALVILGGDAVIYEENGPGSRYRLAFGQRDECRYNGRQWIRHVSEIRTIDPDE